MAFSSIGIGKISGISIELHWTFILLLAFSFLISDLFFILILLLFICVLIHELAHSITAMRNKISVKKIILLPIGGASIIDDIRMDPKVELKIALAGPVMSLFLGFGFGVLSILTPLGPLTFLAQSLFVLNIFMGVFNILPAFPMDGGRVFRSYLERKRNFFDATLLTIKISKYLMGIIILITLLFFAFANSYSLSYRAFIVFWDFIIVIFLYGGAQAEEQALILRKNTQGLHIIDAKSKSYLFVKPDSTIASIYAQIKKNNPHLLITKVGQEYMLLNLFTKLKDPQNKRAKDISTPIPSVAPKMNVFDALTKMQSLEVGVVAIVEKGKLLGVATNENLQSFISIHIMSKKAT